MYQEKEGVIKMIQNYINELVHEVEYLKYASIQLQALNEELQEGDDYNE